MPVKPSHQRESGAATGDPTLENLSNHGIDLHQIENADIHVAEVVVTYCGTIVDASHVGQDAKGPVSFSIGESPEASFPATGDGLPDAAAFPMVLSDSHGVVIRFTDSMEGRVKLGNQHLSLAELVSTRRAVDDGGSFRFPLPSGARARLTHGQLTFHVRAVPAGRKVAGRGGIDKRLWGYVGSTAIAAASVFSLLSLVPNDVLAFDLADDTVDSRFAGYHHIADQQEEPEEQLIDEATDTEQQGGNGQRHEGTEGKAGKPKAERQHGVYKMKGPATAIPKLARYQDPSMQASEAGILGMMQKEQGGFMASPYGAAFQVGNDDEDIWGGLTGTDYAEANGVGGLGLVGTGQLGGGSGQGVMGLGNVGTIGKGAGGGKGIGYGPGNGKGVGFRNKGIKKPVVRVAKGDIKGNIDKSIIRRIVRSHINEVRACYNQGLVRNPNLRGRVAVQFSIGGTGKVLSAVVGESSLKDSQVGKCVAKAVKRWKFPKPSSGGMVLVTYPFTMDPAS
jgi:TonB family protein